MSDNPWIIGLKFFSDQWLTFVASDFKILNSVFVRIDVTHSLVERADRHWIKGRHWNLFLGSYSEKPRLNYFTYYFLFPFS